MSAENAAAAATATPTAAPTTPATPTPDPANPRPWRDEQGRFVAHNRCAPGNPFARQVAALRAALVKSVSAEDIEEVGRKYLELAKAGNLQAGRLLFSYVLGKPAQQPNPDNLNAEEWAGYFQTNKMVFDLQYLMPAPKPQLPLALVRASQEGATDDWARKFKDALEHPEKYQSRPRVDLVAERRPKPSPTGTTVTDPSQVIIGPPPNGGPSTNRRPGRKGKKASKSPSPNGAHGGNGKAPSPNGASGAPNANVEADVEWLKILSRLR